MSGKSARAARKNVPPVKAKQQIQTPRSRMPRLVATSVAVGLVAVVGLYFLSSFHRSGGTTASNASSAYPYAVGSPSPGQQAPGVRLPATTGGTFDLASYRGKKPVLLYFQEGLTCQPCWDQIAAIQKEEAKFHALGIGPIVSITTDKAGDIARKAKDENLSIPVLSDEGGQVSDSYSARDYGMMGHSRDGHSFIVIGKDGKILWRADYGGAPRYTMFVPVNVLLTQLEAGIKGQTGARSSS